MANAPKIVHRAAADLKPSATNARTHSPAQITRIAGLLTRFGFTQPVLADTDGIVAGHGRVLAAQQVYAAGGTLRYPGGVAIPAGAVPVIDCTGWSADERRAYMLADNQVALESGWDMDLLTAELDALAAVDFDIASIGFDTAALDALTGGGDAAGGTGRSPGDGTQTDTTFVHVDRYGVIVMCKDEAEQEARFNAAVKLYGAEQVKVVVV